MSTVKEKTDYTKAEVAFKKTVKVFKKEMTTWVNHHLPIMLKEDWNEEHIIEQVIEVFRNELEEIIKNTSRT